MSETSPSTHDGLLGLIGAALDDLSNGKLDSALPGLAEAQTDRERELVGQLRELVASRRRAAEKLQHLAAAFDGALGDVRERVTLVAGSNAEVTNSAEAGEASA